MRKLKLLFAACALLVSAGVQAQSWTGSEVGEGYALLYNVGTGQYFTRGNGWGTQASIGGEGAAMTVYLQAFDGKYKIRTQNSYGVECLSGSTVYTDQSRDKNSTWTFEEIDATNHVYNIISADNHGDGFGKYLTAEGGSSTIVGPGNDGTIGNAKWKVYLYTDQQAQLQTAMANATAEAPVDVSAYIKDANFGAFPDIALECWSKTVTNWNLNGGDLLNPCAETYRNGGGKIYQTIAVPNGTYKVLCQGFNRFDGGSTPSYLYANEETPVELKGFNANGEGTASNMSGASTSFTAGNYENEIQVVVTGESLTIGIEGQDGNWTCFDNFRLMYLGPLDLSEIIAAYETALGAANAVDQNSVMNKDVLKDLQDAISTYSNVNNTDQDALSAATTALTEATNNATTSIANYESLKTAIDDFDAKCASLDADGKAAADAAASDAKNAYENGTATDGVAEKAALNDAFRAGVLNTKQPGDGLDMTAYIVNPGIDGNVNGWTCNINNNGGYAGGPLKPSNDAMEFWAAGTLTDQDKGKSFDYYQTLTGLPEGAYTVGASMLNSTNGETGAVWDGGCKAGLYASTASEAVDVRVTTDDETFRPYTTAEILVLSGELRIGVKNFEALTGRWFAADNFKLTYVRQLNDEEKATIAKTEYETALAAAQAIESGTIPTKNYQTLQGVIANNTVPDGSTAEQYEKATAALNEAATGAATLVEPYATWKTLCATGKTIAPQSEHPAVYNAIIQIENAMETNLVDASTLEQGNTMARSLISSYPAWLELKENATILVDVANNNSTANATLRAKLTALSNQISNFEVTDLTTAGQLVAAIPQATSQLKAAMTTYVTTAEPTNDECFDLTFLIVNPHFTEGTATNPTGWTVNYPAASDGEWHGKELRTSTHNFEAFHSQFTLSQTIPNMKKGTYKVTLQGFARHDDANVTDKTSLFCGDGSQIIKDINAEYSTTSYYDDTKTALGDTNYDSPATIGGETIYRPNGMTGAYYWFQEENPLTKQPFYTSEVPTLLANDGDLTLGFKCETWKDWVIWDNFHLYYYGTAIKVTLDEDNGTSYTADIENANVTLKKTIYEGWNTITIPFEASADNFNGSELYKYTGDDATTLYFEPATFIEPNVPYLLKATEATDGAGTFTFNGVTVMAADELTTEGTNYNFLGTYQETTVADGDYILGEDAFYRSNGGNKVKAYRAYIKKNADAIEGARLNIVIDGEVTAIDTIDGKAINNATIYNLSGQKVSKAQKGLYIQNGKKLVVK